MSQMTNTMARPKTRPQHFSATAVEEFRKSTADLRQPFVQEQQTVAEAGQQKPVSPIPPIQTQPVQGVPQNSAPTPKDSVQSVPVQNIPIPDGYQDLFGEAFAPVEEPKQQMSDTSKELEEYKQRNAELMKELEESRAALEASKKLSDDLVALRDEQELDSLIKASGSDFRSIDPEDVKKLLGPIIKTVRNQHNDSINQMQTRLTKQQELLNARFQELDAKEQRAMLDRTRAAILKAHPDLESLQKSTAYQQTMMSRIGGKSNVLVGQLVAAEYKRGNADYVIAVLDKIKSDVGTNLDDIASVSPSAGASGPAASVADTSGRLTDAQIAELRFKVQNRQISRKEFREKMEKHREAYAAASRN